MHASQMAQLMVLLQCFLLGGVIGILYDVLRAARRAFHLKGVGTAVCDFIFCACFLFGLFQFCITLGLGQNRIFILVGIVLGWAVYWMMAGMLVLRFSMGLFRLLAKTGTALWHVVMKCMRAVRKLWRRISAEKNLDVFKKNTSIFKRKGLK